MKSTDVQNSASTPTDANNVLEVVYHLSNSDKEKDEYFTEKRIIIWARKRNFNNTRGKALASGYEPICYYCNGDNGE